MDLKLKDAKVVVAGGSRGIGKSIVHCMASEGCIVHYCARNLAPEFNSEYDNIIGEVVDFTNIDSFSRWIKKIGDFDIFIANISAMSSDWKSSLMVDIMATVNAIGIVIPYMENSKFPAITYVGSKASSIAIPGFEAYAASKIAVTHYMKSISKILINKGIRVNVISPGDTFHSDGFWDVIKKRNVTAFTEKEARSPFGRLASPEEIAQVITFVSSPMASYISGANILVDGGMTDHIQV